MTRLPRRALAVALLSLATLVAPGAPGAPDPAAGAPTPRAVSAPAPTCGGVTPEKPSGGTYRCTFTDDFGGWAIDGDKWMAQATSYSGFTDANRDCFTASSRNVSVSYGAAHIRARYESAPFVCRSPYGNFTTRTTAGTLATRARFDQTYGRFEFRARFPRTTVAGAHSALWMYPATNTYGAWPKSGEIDVAEWFSGLTHHVIPSVHYKGEPAPDSSGADCLMSDPWNYHRYAVEWTRSTMYFLYDGQQCFHHSWTPDAPLVSPQPFDQPFYLVLSQGFGALWNAPTLTTPHIVTMDVDWVRAWS